MHDIAHDDIVDLLGPEHHINSSLGGDGQTSFAELHAFLLFKGQLTSERRIAQAFQLGPIDHREIDITPMHISQRNIAILIVASMQPIQVGVGIEEDPTQVCCRQDLWGVWHPGAQAG